MKTTKTPHTISIRCEPPTRDGALVLNGGHRARCSCGWASDCYSQLSDTQRAVDVHLRRMQRADFDKLIEASSIGGALADIKARGLDAHLAELENEMNRRFHKPRKKHVVRR